MMIQKKKKKKDVSETFEKLVVHRDFSIGAYLEAGGGGAFFALLYLLSFQLPN
jgi:hypothetical protein